MINLTEQSVERAPSIERFRLRPMKECSKKGRRRAAAWTGVQENCQKSYFSSLERNWWLTCYDNIGHISKFQGESTWWVRNDRLVRIQKERNGKECFHFQGGGANIFQKRFPLTDIKSFFLVKNKTIVKIICETLWYQFWKANIFQVIET